MRHFTRLSQDSFGVDLGPYPLGSCTMKYNPKRNDALAELPGFSRVHPAQSFDSMSGLWSMYANLQDYFAEVTGMDAFTLQPAAGTHGELTGLLMIRAYFEQRRRPLSHSHPRLRARHHPASAADVRLHL